MKNKTCQRPQSGPSRLALAGELLLLAALGELLSAHLAQTLIPGYDPNLAAISGLGSSFFSSGDCLRRLCNQIVQPASWLFIASRLVSGACILLAAVQLRRRLAPSRFVSTLALVGLGELILAISYAPLYLARPRFAVAFGLHVSGWFLVFMVGSLAILFSRPLLTPLVARLSLFFGLFSLIASPLSLFIFISSSRSATGFGALERLIVDVFLLWLAAFGATLIATPAKAANDPRS